MSSDGRQVLGARIALAGFIAKLRLLRCRSLNAITITCSNARAHGGFANGLPGMLETQKEITLLSFCGLPHRWWSAGSPHCSLRGIYTVQ